MRYLLANGQYLRIREAGTGDAAALLKMYQQVVTESDFLMTTPAEAGKLNLEHEKEFIASYQRNSNQLFLIAEVEGMIAGTLSITQARPEKQQHLGELGIVVARKYWNMGIGRRMMNTMLQWVRDQTVIQYIYLTVMANNEKAIRLYRNFGFTEEGRRMKAIREYGNSFRDVISMGKWFGE